MFIKKIFKKEHIDDIYDRYKSFYKKSLSSNTYLVLKPFKKGVDYIGLDEKDFSNIYDYNNFINDKTKILLLVNAIIDFYCDNNNDIFEENIILHGDLHLGNIFFLDNKVLFIDFETPNNSNYEDFTYNNILFELSFLLFQLDNLHPSLSSKFYMENSYFKNIFLCGLKSRLNNDIDLSILLKYYKKHLNKQFVFTLNPFYLFNRLYRFFVIYIKIILFKKKI